MEFRYRFDSTAEDLLDADRVANRVGCFRRSLWVVGAVLGLLWLLSAVAGGEKSTPIGRLFLGLAGLGLISAFILKPYLNRRRIREAAGSSPADIDVVFNEDGITVNRREGTFQLEWANVRRIESVPAGVLLLLRNRGAHWLPARVFKNADEKSRFVSFVSHHIRRIARE